MAMKPIRINLALFASLAIVLGVASCKKDLPEEYTELVLSHCLTPTSLGAFVENDNEAVISWQASKDADSYELVLAEDAEITEVVKTLIVPVDQVPVRIVLDPGTYYYKVRALSEKREASNWAIAKGKITIKEPVIPVDLSAKGTANCYVVSKEGMYKFKPTQGCESTSVGDIASVDIVWITATEDSGTALDINSLITTPYLASDGYIYFYTQDPYKVGNALIAARDSGGTILWSWHIWITEDEVKDVDWGDGMILMDRNIGEATVGAAPRTSMLYQFGRKDPFPGSTGNNNLVAVAGTATTFANKQLASATSAAEATKTPTVLYGVKSTSSVGAQPHGLNDNSYLWGDYATNAKTKKDPCPPGYKVPQAWASQPSAPQNDITTSRFAKLSQLTYQAASSGNHVQGTFDATLSNGSYIRFGRTGYILINTDTTHYADAGSDVKTGTDEFLLWTASCTGTSLKRIATCLRVSATDGASLWAKSGDAAARYHSKNNAFAVRCEKIQ